MEEKNYIEIDDKLYDNTVLKSVPKPQPEIGIDVNQTILKNISKEAEVSQLNLTEFLSFDQTARSRNQLYDQLDAMSDDPIISAVLKTFAEDSTEYNDQGRIVWAESPDADVVKYITFLLDTLNVDKYIYQWALYLCKYGDIYLRLYRESEYEDALHVKTITPDEVDLENKKKTLTEDIKLKVFSKNDKLVHYLEMCPNPAEIFDLVKFSKTYGYIKASVDTTTSVDTLTQYRWYKNKFNKNDVEVYGPTEFVHGCLQNDTSRNVEEVDLFLDNDNSTKITYQVKRGQALLYNLYKIWRELSLLENSIMLNRVTKSSIVRILNVEVGDMPKEMVGPHIARIKQLLEQKSAINTGESLTEYNNPGPVENTVYVPTNNGKGAITPQEVGGNVDVKSLADLDYFKNKFWGTIGIPKEFFGDTDGSGGFDAGGSLSVISSRFAKTIKRIQNALIQMITDAINIILIDKGMPEYVNHFTIKMLPPATQEEVARKEMQQNSIGIVSDIMNILSDVDNQTIKLKIAKSLLSNVVSNPDFTDLLQEQIDKLEANAEDEDVSVASDDSDNLDINIDNNFDTSQPLDLDNKPAIDVDTDNSENVEEPNSDTIDLPSPDQLGLDMTDNTQSI